MTAVVAKNSLQAQSKGAERGECEGAERRSRARGQSKGAERGGGGGGGGGGAREAGRAVRGGRSAGAARLAQPAGAQAAQAAATACPPALPSRFALPGPAPLTLNTNRCTAAAATPRPPTPPVSWEQAVPHAADQLRGGEGAKGGPPARGRQPLVHVCAGSGGGGGGGEGLSRHAGIGCTWQGEQPHSRCAGAQAGQAARAPPPSPPSSPAAPPRPAASHSGAARGRCRRSSWRPGWAARR